MRKTVATFMLGLLLTSGAAFNATPNYASLWWWPFGDTTPTATATQPAVSAQPTATATTVEPGTMPTPQASTSNPPAPPVTDVKTLNSSGKTVRGILYRIELQQLNAGGRIDGYQVVLYRNGVEITHVTAAKADAKRIYAAIQKYKPTTQQMLIARLLVLALL